MYSSGRKIYLYLYLLIAAIVAVACGGEHLAGGGIGGTGITSGTVTGFGSVFVNGVEFDTTGAIRTVDDVVTVSNGTDDITVMGQGMVVTVRGTINADGVTGTATSLDFDEVVEGPVADIPIEDADMVTRSFDVLGIHVVINRNSTVFVDTDYSSVGKNDLIEVSGFLDAAGNLLATHVDKEGVLAPGSTVEVHGKVSGFNGVDSFMLGSVTVTFDGATAFEGLPGTVADDQFVEVSGTLSGATSVDAMRIELEENSFTSADSVSLEGVVTLFNGSDDFSVSGQQVDASAATFTPLTLATTIANDSRVEVRGSLSGGVLTATSVEDRGAGIKVGGEVIFVDAANGIVTVEVVAGEPVVTVNVGLKTQLEDDLGIAQPFTLNDLMPGNEVIVEGVLGSGATVDASKLKRKTLDKHELQGPVQAASGNDLAGSITVLGVTISTDNSTEFEDVNDQNFPNGGDDFYNQVSVGNVVEIEDEKPVDGLANEVELKI